MLKNQNQNKMKMKKYFTRGFICFYLVLMISGAFTQTNILGVNILIYTPIFLIPLLIVILIDSLCIHNNSDKEVLFVVLYVIAFFLFPIFLGIYFGIFHPIFNLEFEKISDCKVIGAAPMNQVSFQKYSILYVDFKYDSQIMLGYACLSSKGNMGFDYTFTYQNEYIVCDTIGSSFEMDKRQLEQLHQKTEEQNQRKRLLRLRGKCNTTGKAPIGSYNFSEVKIPNWFCGDINTEFEELSKSKTCYVHYFNNRNDSYNNSKDRLNLKSVQNFALVVFDYPPYYPYEGLVCLIVFTYLPSMLSLYHLSTIIQKLIFKMIKNYDYKVHSL